MLVSARHLTAVGSSPARVTCETSQCGQIFFSGNTRFQTTLQLTRLQMSEVILTGRKTSIKKHHTKPRVVRIGRTPTPLAQSVETRPIDVPTVCHRWRHVRRKRGSWRLRDTGCLSTPLLPRIRCTRVTVKA